MTHRPPTWLSRWVAVLSNLVPGERRARWREEWTSELWYGFTSPTRSGYRRSLSLALGSCIDAVTVRRHHHSPATRRHGDGIVPRIVYLFRHSVRSLRRAPGFTAVVVLTLALGIGANTAVFNVLYGTLLKPLRYQEPDRLVRLYITYGPDSFNGGYLPGADFRDYRDRVEAFQHLTALYDYRETGFNLTGDGAARRVRALRIAADYFSVYRVAPILGRVFTREEETADHRLVILSHHLWQEHSGGRADVLGTTLELNGVLYEVVGVMPEGFYDLVGGDVDLWIPLDLRPDITRNNRGNHYLTAIGRLRPDVTLAQARGEVDRVAQAIREQFPDAAQERRAILVPLAEDVAGNAPTLLFLLMGASGLVLLIACVNVANLYLTRTAGRARELAVRAALGSGRGRLARQIVAESIVLAGLGGLLGSVIAYAGTRAMLSLGGTGLARAHEIALDGPVLIFTFGVTLLTGLGFGLFPAWRMSRPDLETALRESARGTSDSRGQRRFRDALVVAQIALALTLLVGAGLLIKSFAQLRNVDLGVRTERTLTFEFNPADAAYDAAGRIALYRTFHDRVRSLPGVTGTAAVSRLPFTGRYHIWGYRQPANPDAGWISTDVRVIEGEYFDLLGVPLLRGRTFEEVDRLGTPPVIVLNQRAAALGFGDTDPLGQTIVLGGREWTVVGIVGDVPHDVEGSTSPKAYVSHRQYGDNRNWALVQLVTYEGDGTGLLPDLRGALRVLDPTLVIHGERSLASLLVDGRAQRRLAMTLLSVFAGIAVVLAAIGVYGVLSYGVQLRTREIGIRIALGATAGSVRSLVTSRGLLLAVTGTVIGLGMAMGLMRFLDSLLFNISVRDPLTFGLVPAGILLVAGVSAFIPAMRATRVDPLDAIRAE